MRFDLRNATVGEFIAVVFDHPPRAEPDDEPWYFSSDLEFAVDPERQVANMTAVLQRAGQLADSYSIPQNRAGSLVHDGRCALR